MVLCYSLIRVKPQRNEQVFRKIQELEFVKKVIVLHGEYDPLVKIEAKNLEELDRFIYSSLRTIPRIVTTTMIARTRG